MPQEVANNAKKFKPRITGFFDKREQKTKIFIRKAGNKECRRATREMAIRQKNGGKKMRPGIPWRERMQKRSESFFSGAELVLMIRAAPLKK